MNSPPFTGSSTDTAAIILIILLIPLSMLILRFRMTEHGGRCFSVLNAPIKVKVVIRCSTEPSIANPLARSWWTRLQSAKLRMPLLASFSFFAMLSTLSGYFVSSAVPSGFSVLVSGSSALSSSAFAYTSASIFAYTSASASAGWVSYLIYASL